MTRLLIFIAVTFFAFFSFSANLDCDMSVNNEIIQKMKTQSRINEKILIGSTELVKAYVTEKQNHRYLIEAFLADFEARLYAEGVLSQNSDLISASLWGRQNRHDVTCKLAEAN